MNRVEKQLDRIIAGLKLNDKLKNVKFVREYGSHGAPTPIRGLVAVVSVTDTTSKVRVPSIFMPS